MNVRNALWIAGLGSVFALPLPAPAQAVTEVPPTTVAPAVVQDVPMTAGVEGQQGFLRYFKRGDPLTPQRFWFNSEALLMWTKSLNVPPLVTTGPSLGLDPGVIPGTLNVPGTMTLVDKQIGFGPAGGGRFTFGGWVLPDAPLGVEVSYMFLGQATGTRHLSETGLVGSQALSFPFFDVVNGTESAASIALPGTTGFGGTVDVRTTTRLQGWEVTAGTDFGNFWGVHVIGLGGYRYLGINESLNFTTSSIDVNGTGVVFRTSDNFSTSNAFNGAQVGLRTEYCCGPLTFNATGKFAFGDIRQQTNIGGSTVTNIYNNLGATQAFNAGYLATGTNSGMQSRDRIAVVPEFQLTTAWQPISWLRLTLGYQGLYINSVARPTDQIDRNINTSQSPAFGLSPSQILVGPARPALLPVAHSDFWVQGLTAGMEFKF